MAPESGRSHTRCGRAGLDHRGEIRPLATVEVAAEGFFDAAAVDVVSPGDALGVNAQEHLDAVASPFGDLGRLDAAVEPGRQAGVAQVVGPPGKSRVRDRRGEREETGTLPGPAVDAFGQVAAAFAAEDPAIRGSTELADMPVDVLGERRVARDGPDFVLGAV